MKLKRIINFKNKNNHKRKFDDAELKKKSILTNLKNIATRASTFESTWQTFVDPAFLDFLGLSIYDLYTAILGLWTNRNIVSSREKIRD